MSNIENAKAEKAKRVAAMISSKKVTQGPDGPMFQEQVMPNFSANPSPLVVEMTKPPKANRVGPPTLDMIKKVREENAKGTPLLSIANLVGRSEDSVKGILGLKPAKPGKEKPAQETLPEGAVKHKFSLRPTFIATLILPSDMTEKEFMRLHKFLELETERRALEAKIASLSAGDEGEEA